MTDEMDRFGVELNQETNAASAGHDSSALSIPLLTMEEIKETEEPREQDTQLRESSNG